MDELVGLTIFHLIINAIGGTIRWIYGTFWRTIFRKQKYSFKEYLYGPKKSKNDWDKQHMLNSGIVGLVFLLVLGWILI